MRIVVVVFAALMTLGLVAFGLVIAQKANDSVPLTAAAAGVSSPQNTESAKNDKAPLRLGEAAKGAASITPTVVAQNNTTAVAAGFTAYARMQFDVAACNKPHALGLSLVIEI